MSLKRTNVLGVIFTSAINHISMSYKLVSNLSGDLSKTQEGNPIFGVTGNFLTI